jgi:hypothetical protein
VKNLGRFKSEIMIPVRYAWKLVILLLVLASIAVSGRAQDKELGDFNLKYGYAYLTASQRSGTSGGTDGIQKLPGEFKFWFNDKIDVFVRSDTVRASRTPPSWAVGAGNTVVGLDLLLRSESKKAPELDFTYDAKLPTKDGFKAGEVDHEAIVSLLKVIGKHSLEGDFGDYIEGIAHASAAHQFELTLSDEIGLKKCSKNCGGTTYRWTTIQELDLTTSSPDTPTEVYQLFKLKYYFNSRFAIAPGVRVTYTPYTGRFSPYVTLYVNGKLRRQ